MRISEIYDDDEEPDVIHGRGRDFLIARPDNTPRQFIRFSAIPKGNRSHFGLAEPDTEDGPNTVNAEYGNMTHEAGVSVFEATPYSDGYRINMPLGCTNQNFARYHISDERRYLMGILSFRANEICAYLHARQIIPTPELIDSPYATVAVTDKATKQPVRSNYRHGRWPFDGHNDAEILKAAAERFDPATHDFKIVSREYLIGHDAKPVEIFLITGEPLIRPLRHNKKLYPTFELGSDGEYLLDTSKPYQTKLIDMEHVYVDQTNMLDWLKKDGVIDYFCRSFLTFG